jgi:hypothetical protein
MRLRVLAAAARRLLALARVLRLRWHACCGTRHAC